MRFSILLVLFSLVGCSLQKMAMRSATPVFQKSTHNMMTEGNWEFFKASSPGNIKMMELMWQQDPENLELLSMVIKSYAGYAFGIHETLAFRDDLEGKEDSPSKKEAIAFYTRAFDYGLFYLSKKGISSSDLLSNDEEKLTKKLKDLDEDDAYAALYTGQVWASLINLQKDNMALISQVPKVKLIFDRVCTLKPDIDHNVCDIFYAQYEAARPKMLGGNPEKGEQLFIAAIEKNPKNLLIRMNYIQFVVIPLMDGEKYEKIAASMKEEIAKWESLNRDSLENTSPYRDVPELNLYNAIAKKRFEFVEKNKKKIF